VVQNLALLLRDLKRVYSSTFIFSCSYFCCRDIVVQKGKNLQIDSYSAFADNDKSSMTELYQILDSHHITDVYVCGM
jgi:hypothetical protein